MRTVLLLLAIVPALAAAQVTRPAPAPATPPRDAPGAPAEPGDDDVAAREAAQAAARERLMNRFRRPEGRGLGLPTGQPQGQIAQTRPTPASPPRPVPARPAPADAAPAGPAGAMRPTDARCTPLSGRVMLNFDKTDIVDVLQQASRWTCRNFIYTDDIARGKITLLSMTPVTADEAYAAFLAALTSNNIAIYPTGRYYKLARAADARKTPIPMLAGEEGTPGTEQPVTKIIRLRYADADQLRGILGNFTSPQGADVQALPPDVLIITDLGVNLRRLEKLIESIDRAGSGDQVRIVQIRYAAAKDIADKVNQIFQAQAGTPGRAPRRTVVGGRPAPGAVPVPASPTEASVSKVLADDRTNKLIVIADEKGFQRIEELVLQLDVPTSGEGGIHVVFLRNANAEELAQTLSNLSQGASAQRRQGSAPPPQLVGLPTPQAAAARSGPGDVTAELFSGEVKITADKTQNALLIQAGGADFVAISRLIEKLDRPRRQVFVEAVILEVNLRNETQFGVSAHGFVPYDVKGETGVFPIASEPSGRFNSFSVSSVVSLGGFLTGFAGPVTAELKALGLNLPSLGLLVQALQKSSDVNVISTPHLVATDNEESEIAVGNNVPFQAGIVPTGLQNLLSGANSNNAAAALLGTSSLGSNIAPIQRQNVELRLKIKPQINEGGSVRLSIEEQVEEISSTDAQLGPTTAKRSVKTQVVAKDQSTIVIGGLIQERAVRSVSKVPLLGSIPILGWLFRDTVTTRSKTNLLLFLTPYIIRDEADYRRIYELKRKEQQEFVEQFYGRQPRYDVELDWSRKAGPYARLRAGVAEEQARLENGGPGAPGEGATHAPTGAAPVPVPGSRPSRAPEPVDLTPPPEPPEVIPLEPGPAPDAAPEEAPEAAPGAEPSPDAPPRRE
jgi:general secretion pathway protein D